eukprot:TRINITY_DN9400_c0_g2_i2.p1 TRINITY_DN9400_c0_g2~~TRINITY_DN9400_c0_g2_i2.p1  ORF type:complete len:566 (+),score=179.96 TRINITY_DN9400_c0_g2_i2:722-2419(+)
MKSSSTPGPVRPVCARQCARRRRHERERARRQPPPGRPGPRQRDEPAPGPDHPGSGDRLRPVLPLHRGARPGHLLPAQPGPLGPDGADRGGPPPAGRAQQPALPRAPGGGRRPPGPGPGPAGAGEGVAMTPRKQKDPRRWVRLRLWILGGCFALAGMVLVGRAVDLQLVERGFLTGKAQKEILREIEIAPNRGIIYDRNQVELALSVGTDSVYARPVAVDNPAQEGRRLAKALGLPAGPVIKRLKGKRHFAWIERRVDPDQAEAVKALELESVGLVTEPRRFYPYTSLACHLLGFAGVDAKGLEGLERQYDKVLTGQGQRVTRARDALGRSFWLAGQPLNTMPQGRHLILTIDKALQYQVEKILAAAGQVAAQGGGLQTLHELPQVHQAPPMAGLSRTLSGPCSLSGAPGAGLWEATRPHPLASTLSPARPARASTWRRVRPLRSGTRPAARSLARAARVSAGARGAGAVWGLWRTWSSSGPGAGRCTPRVLRVARAMAAQAGPATVPPQWRPWGVSITTRITAWGSSAGRQPTKLDMYSLWEQPPSGFTFWAVPVLPATLKGGT